MGKINIEFYDTDDGKCPVDGFVKKTQKTPPGEIALAKKYKADYERRNL